MVVATYITGLIYKQVVESVYPSEFRIESSVWYTKEKINDIVVLWAELFGSPVVSGFTETLPNYAVPVPTAVRSRYSDYAVEWRNLGICLVPCIYVNYEGFHFADIHRLTSLIGYLVDEGVLVMDYRSRYEKPIKALSFNMFSFVT
jgi:hypothetical protein